MINIKNIDNNEYFKWCLARCLNPADHHPARIKKANKDFTKRLDFKDIRFTIKTRDIHKIQKRIPSGLVFLVVKIRKKIQSIYQKNVMKKSMLIYY